MGIVTDKSELRKPKRSMARWCNDAALGVAVREVGSPWNELHVRALTTDGAHALGDAIDVSYGCDGTDCPARIRGDGDTYYAIDAAHRLAFSRALGCPFAPVRATVQGGRNDVSRAT